MFGISCIHIQKMVPYCGVGKEGRGKGSGGWWGGGGGGGGGGGVWLVFVLALGVGSRVKLLSNN